MTHGAIFDAVFRLEAALGASWPNIRASHRETTALHRRMADDIADLTGEDASIVVFGSLGRFEATSDSDIDWTYLIDGQADLRHQTTALEADALISRMGKNKPGREGVFGALAFSHDLLQYIGGQDDTNANLTRRILLLLESKPVGRRDAYDRVIRVVLDRYLSGDHGWIRARTPYGVPRFLYNDIARYWRTVAVDFAYKQWTRDNRGWALRSTKLRLSRKLTYAAGMLYCFSLASDSAGLTEPMRKQRAIERLWALSNRTPLDLVAEAFSASPTLAAPARSALEAYDRFLGILDNGKRKHLDGLSPEDADRDELYQQMRALDQAFQAGLSALFLTDDSTLFPQLTREYGVF